MTNEVVCSICSIMSKNVTFAKSKHRKFKLKLNYTHIVRSDQLLNVSLLSFMFFIHIYQKPTIWLLQFLAHDVFVKTNRCAIAMIFDVRLSVWDGRAL